MKVIKKIIRHFVLFSIVLFLIYVFAEYSVKIYKFFNPLAGVGSVAVLDFTPVVVLPLEYLFFICFVFTAFGDSTKYWWIGILLIPAAVFELYFDLEHIYIPVAIGLIGWVIGFVISKIIDKLKTIKSRQR